MTRILIIADDLTGALDSGVQFSAKGMSVIVSVELHVGLEAIRKEQAEVFVFDTESRHISRSEAGKRIKEVIKEAKDYDFDFIYKKTDSTLRGNVGSELEALIDATDVKALPFVPAWPENKRTVKDGILYVDGVELKDTGFAKDPLNPISRSDIVGILKDNGASKAKNVKPGEYADCEKSIIVYDAQTDEDLINISKVLKENENLKVTAGCAKFAEILVDAFDLEKEKKNFETSSDIGKMLVVCGSLNEVSHKQIKYAKEILGYNEMTLPQGILLADDKQKEQELIQLAEETAEAFEKETLMIKTLPVIHAASLTPEENSLICKQIAVNIGHFTKIIIQKGAVSTLVVFGGDTLLEVLKRLSVFSLRPQKEIALGVVLSHIEYEGRKLNLITKAGGFGEENVLYTVRQYLNK